MERSAGLLGVGIDRAGAELLASRARGTPRVANRLLRRARDYAQVRAAGHIDAAVAGAALEVLGVDGLGPRRHGPAGSQVLCGALGGHPVGLQTMAVSVQEDPDTVEDIVEPFLIRLGFLARTPRGGWPPPTPTAPRAGRARAGAPGAAAAQGGCSTPRWSSAPRGGTRPPTSTTRCRRSGSPSGRWPSATPPGCSTSARRRPEDRCVRELPELLGARATCWWSTRPGCAPPACAGHGGRRPAAARSSCWCWAGSTAAATPAWFGPDAGSGRVPGWRWPRVSTWWSALSAGPSRRPARAFEAPRRATSPRRSSAPATHRCRPTSRGRSTTPSATRPSTRRANPARPPHRPRGCTSPRRCSARCERGVAWTTCELEVGPGHLPPDPRRRGRGARIHGERYEAARGRRRGADRTGGRVVAVGTTAVRTLETCARQAPSPGGAPSSTSRPARVAAWSTAC